MGVAVGHLGMDEKQIFQNVQMSVNFLVSLLKKNWQNVCSLSPSHTCARFILEIFGHKLCYARLLNTLYPFAGEVLVPEEHNGKAAQIVLNISYL
jgi:hypothetical protein